MNRLIDVKQLLGIAAILLVFSAQVFATAPSVVDSQSFVDTNTNVASLTQSFTAGTADYMLVAHTAYEVDNTISGVTYNGVSMTALNIASDIAHNQNDSVQVFGLINPAAGAHNIVVTYSSNRQYEGGLMVVTFSGVTAVGNKVPVDTAGGAGFVAADTSPLTDNITSGADQIVVDFTCANGTLTVDASQTQLFNQAVGGERQSASTKVNASSMVWTFTGTLRTAHSLIALNGAAASSGPPLGTLNLLGVGR